jgi:hypothetical protein
MKKILIVNYKENKTPEWYLDLFRVCNISIIVVQDKDNAECWGTATHIETLKTGLRNANIKFVDLP